MVRLFGRNFGLLTARSIPDTDALFVLSTGRTGTMWLAGMLGLSGKADAYHEPPPKLYGERKSIFNNGDPRAEWIKEGFIRARRSMVNSSRKKGNVYIETSGFLSFHTPAIHDLLPSAKFLFLYRDPLEFVKSGLLRNWYNRHPNDGTRLKPLPGSDEYKVWEEWGQAEKIAWLWYAYNKMCLRCLDLINEERVMVAKCTELWDEGSGKTEALCEFIGLDDVDGTVIAREKANPKNAQLTSNRLKPDIVNGVARERVKNMTADILARVERA